jgi:hypothetical protein
VQEACWDTAPVKTHCNCANSRPSAAAASSLLVWRQRDILVHLRHVYQWCASVARPSSSCAHASVATPSSEFASYHGRCTASASVIISAAPSSAPSCPMRINGVAAASATRGSAHVCDPTLIALLCQTPLLQWNKCKRWVATRMRSTPDAHSH